MVDNSSILHTNTPILLASQSPRRSELLKQMGYNFDVLAKNTDESFDTQLSPEEAVKHVLNSKINAFEKESQEYLVICADTMVAIDNEILGKPSDQHEAYSFLKRLSNRKHQVITGVGLAHLDQKLFFTEETQVYFRSLDDREITYYVDQYKPMDKAGSYGIQEWIGHIGIQEIKGSYTNVMGLPTATLYVKLQEFMARFS